MRGTRKQMVGSWRWIYVVTAIVAQYLNFFVLIVQAFQKVPALHDLAPNQNEPPFAIAQGVALVVFIVLGHFGGEEIPRRAEPGDLVDRYALRATTRWKCSCTSRVTTRRTPSTRQCGSLSSWPRRMISSSFMPGGTVKVD